MLEWFHFILFFEKNINKAWQEKVTLRTALRFIIGDWNEATEFGDVILVMLFVFFRNMYE